MLQYCFHISEADVIYAPLPLYHTSATVIAIGQMVINGCTVALRKKFSASNFWNDCIMYHCTVSCGNWSDSYCRTNYWIMNTVYIQEHLYTVQ